MALTTQQIHQKADELHEQGIKPTLANVRTALGGGSFTTISDAMQSWREEHKEEQQLQQVDLPSGITERLHTLGADVWRTAIEIANDRLAKERDALEIIKAKAQQEVEEHKESVRTLEEEQDELLKQLDELTNKAEKAEATAEQAEAELDSLKLENAELKGELKAVKQERDKLTSATEKLTDAHATLKAEHNELSKEHSDLIENLDKKK